MVINGIFKLKLYIAKVKKKKEKKGVVIIETLLQTLCINFGFEGSHFHGVSDWSQLFAL